MTLTITQLRKIYDDAPPPQRAGAQYKFYVRDTGIPDWVLRNPPVPPVSETIEVGTLVAEWVLDDDTHREYLRWTLGDVKVVLDKSADLS
jgi:hypothetical protein